MNESNRIATQKRKHNIPIIPFIVVLLVIFLQFSSTCFSLPISPSYIHIESAAKEGPVIVIEKLKERDQSQSFKNLGNLFKQKQYDKIIELAQSVIKKHPDSGLAFEILGTALFMKQSNMEAINALKKASKLEPRLSGAFAKLGIVYLKNEEMENAENYLQKAILLNNNNNIAHQYLGLIFEYKQNNDAAIKHFAKGLQGTNTTYLGVAANLGRLLNQNNRFQDTIAILKPRLPLTSPVSEAHLILGTAYYQLRQYDKSELRFKRVTEITPDIQEGHIGFSMSLRQNGKLNEALKHTEEILEGAPNWLPAIMEYGETLLLLGHTEKARKYFDQGIGMGSNSAAVEKRFAYYYHQNKEFTKAKEIFNQLISNKSADANVFVQLSEIHQAEGKFKKGHTALQNGIQIYPKNGYLYYRLGSYLASLKKYAEALPELKKAQALSPNDPLILQTICLIQAKAGKHNKALETARKLTNLLPQDSRALILLATRLKSVEQEKEAAEVYKQVLALDSNNTIALNNLAVLLADKGEFEEAEKLARRLNSLADDKNGPFLDTLGWILYQKGQYKVATKTLKAASTAAPQMAVIQFHLGMSLAAEGKKEAARKTLKHAIGIGPNQKWINEAQNKLQEL